MEVLYLLLIRPHELGLPHYDKRKYERTTTIILVMIMYIGYNSWKGQV